MKIKYISCDGETEVEEEIIKAEFCDYINNDPDLMCTRPDGSMIEIDYCDVFEITSGGGGMDKGEIIQENLRLKGLLDHCNKRLTQALYTIDELTKENAELKDWKAKWEERYHAGI